MANYTPRNTNFSQLSKRLEEINLIMVAVVIVMFIGFATLILSTYGIFRDNEAEKTATFQELKTQVQDQNNNIKNLNESIEDLSDQLRKAQPTIQQP